MMQVCRGWYAALGTGQPCSCCVMQWGLEYKLETYKKRNKDEIKTKTVLSSAVNTQSKPGCVHTHSNHTGKPRLVVYKDPQNE